MTMKRVPDVTFKTRVRDDSIDGPNPYRWEDTTTADLFGGKRVVVFSLPGAFTPTCSSNHLPRYDELFEEFQKESSRIINKQERKHSNNKPLNKFIKFVEKNKLMLGELRRKDEWGVYNGKSVILDAGINKDNYEIAF